MDYEAPVGAIAGRRNRQRVLAAVVVVGLLIAAGLASALASREPPSGAAAIAANDVSVTPPASPGDGAGPLPGGANGRPSPAVREPRIERPVPNRLACRDLERVACLRIARAAVLALPQELPPVTAATAWRSLLCNDTLDCPSRYLDGAEPLGSIIFEFADGSTPVALNVVDWRIGLGPKAWLLDGAPPFGPE